MTDYRYQTLGARFVAGIIDAIVVFPFLAVMFAANLSEVVTWLVGVAMIIVNTAYFVVLHGRSGQTIGKRVMRVRVVRASDESPISYGQSLWRESPLILINVAFFVLEALLLASDHEATAGFIGTAYAVIQPIPNSWWIADAMTTLFNGKRRSIHDFIGGTVVVNEG
jgi:uncharacterized RDD family membrane protein YckC